MRIWGTEPSSVSLSQKYFWKIFGNWFIMTTSAHLKRQFVHIHRSWCVHTFPCVYSGCQQGCHFNLRGYIHYVHFVWCVWYTNIWPGQLIHSQRDARTLQTHKCQPAVYTKFCSPLPRAMREISWHSCGSSSHHTWLKIAPTGRVYFPLLSLRWTMQRTALHDTRHSK